MDITLVILAAGIGTRYGAGIKQLAKVGPKGEPIIDYSVRDAVEAGFNKIVFIIRKAIADDFMEVIGNRMETYLEDHGVKWEYVYQEMNNLPEGRTKPWGTGHAVLCCKDILHGPFAVLNADDYYGKTTFQKAYAFCKTMDPAGNQYGMMGYILKNTITTYGSVTRGICSVDETGELIGVAETRHVIKTPDGRAVIDNKPGAELDPDALVSMNFWLFPPQFLPVLEEGFAVFRKNLKDPILEEYLLPTIVDGLLKEKKCAVTVIPTTERWLGITHRADVADVVEALKHENR